MQVPKDVTAPERAVKPEPQEVVESQEVPKDKDGTTVQVAGPVNQVDHFYTGVAKSAGSIAS